jgi:sugar-specific transcriptional regulator TrmB
MNIEETLTLFNLNDKEKKIYLLLAKSSWDTVLSLSRKSNIKRTTLYNILDSLIDKGFVDIKIEEKTTYYNVASIEKIQLQIEKQKSTINKMQDGLQILSSNLTMLANNSHPKIAVHFYRGLSGVESVEWKTASEKNTETLILGTTQWRQKTGLEFTEKMRQLRVENNATIKELLNPGTFEKISNKLEASWTQNKEYLKKILRHREVDKKILDISNETLVCKDSIYFYSFDTDETIVVEITNRGYANMFRNLFMLAWNQAKIKDDFGN